MPGPVLNPSIRTARLLIRAPIVQDAAGVAALYANPATTEYEPRKPQDVSEAVYREKIGRWIGMREEGKMCLLLIIKPDSPDNTGSDGKVIGVGGINGFNENKSGNLIADIGVAIDSSEWRKGYAKEVFIATVEYVLGKEVGCEGVAFQTMASNQPFRAFIRALGFGDVEQTLHNGDFEECDYEISRERWRQTFPQ